MKCGSAARHLQEVDEGRPAALVQVAHLDDVTPRRRRGPVFDARIGVDVAVAGVVVLRQHLPLGVEDDAGSSRGRLVRRGPRPRR